MISRRWKAWEIEEECPGIYLAVRKDAGLDARVRVILGHGETTFEALGGDGLPISLAGEVLELVSWLRDQVDPAPTA